MIVKQKELYICRQASTCKDDTCPHKVAHSCAEDCKEEECSRQIERRDVGCIIYIREWDI